MVYAPLASTDLPWWQTPDGLFRIWLKRRIGDMTGGSPDGEYYGRFVLSRTLDATQPVYTG